jgi:two-component system, chemotaxis family, chemotaxis protein CheY
MASVLIVDDEPRIRELLREALEHAGHTVAEAADGASALALARTTTFDVAILDVVMPVMGGLEALMSLRRKQPALGVIVISGAAQTDAQPFTRLVERLGVRHVFTKPLVLAEILAAVAEATPVKKPRR